MPPEDEKGRWSAEHDADTWQKREHDEVMRTMDRALADVRFPASKSKLAEQAGGANVTEDTALPLVKYLQALPDQRFKSADEVKQAITDRWQEMRGLRGAGTEATREGGARE